MSDAFDPTTLVESAATRVRDPLSGRSAWLARIVQDVRMDGDALRFDLVFKTEHARDDRRAIEQAIVENLRGLGFEGEVRPFPRLEAGAKRPPPQEPVRGMRSPPGAVQPHGGAIRKQKLEGVKHVICVASGKGGVGKSTVSTNLAVALQRLGHPTGLLDADIYGPSLPRMMNVSQKPMVDDDKRILPVYAYGVRCISVGLLVDEDEAMIWRGPMIMGVIRQFLQDVRWGELDYLVVDLPPGTGDAQLTLIQGVEIAGAVIVTTPQDVALADAVRGITMFRKLEVPVLGVVENMAWYELPDGTRDHVFGEGGGLRIAERFWAPVLGQIPLRTALRRSGDQGLPAALGDDSTAKAFLEVARQVVEQLSAGEG